MPRLFLRIFGPWLLTCLTVAAGESFTFTATPAVYSAAGGTITFAVALNYGATASALSLTVVAPNEGWTFAGAAGSAVPQIVPSAGDIGNLGEGFGFLYFNIPPSPASFTFGLKYPAKMTEPQTFQASAVITDASGHTTALPATVTLTLPPVAPAITTQPADTTASAGSIATLTVVVTGTTPLSYQWRKNTTVVPGATAATLTLGPLQTTDTATYDVVITNASGSITSRAAKLTVVTVPTSPLIATQPQNATAAVGSIAVFTVAASGTPVPTYLWQRLPAGATTWSNLGNNASYAGVTTATLTVGSTTQAMNGDQFRCMVTNSAGTATSGVVTLTVTYARLSSLSIRAIAGTGDQTLIVGLEIAGSGTKQVLLRGIGPTLSQYNVAGVLADPSLKLFNASGAQVYQNNDWGGGTTLSNLFTQVSAFALPPASKDAALSILLPTSSYTAQVTGATSTATGVALIEAYETDPGVPSARFVGLSARNQVGTGENILVAGFVVGGNVPLQVLIRAVGPTLASFGVSGVLADPKLELYGGSQKIGENDDWGGTAPLRDAFTVTQEFPLPANSKDAAMLITLPPGLYTAQVSGVGNTTGVALIEVYEVP
jgi:hypothetical protein